MNTSHHSPHLTLLDPQWRLVMLALKHFLLELKVAASEVSEDESGLDWQSVGVLQTSLHIALLSAQDLISAIEIGLIEKERRRQLFGDRHRQAERHMTVTHGCLASLPAILLEFSEELRTTDRLAEASLVLDLAQLLERGVAGA